MPLGQTEGSSHASRQAHARAALRGRGVDIFFARRLLSGAYGSDCLTHEGRPAPFFGQRVSRRAHRSAHEDRSALLPLREPGVRPSHPPLVENNIHSSPTQRYCAVLVRCVRNGTGLESRRVECLLLAPKQGRLRRWNLLLAGAPARLVRTIVNRTSNAPGAQQGWAWFVQTERDNLSTAAAVGVNNRYSAWRGPSMWPAVATRPNLAGRT